MGTAINVVAILVGGGLGLLLGNRVPERMRNTVIGGLGLFTLAYGLQMFFKAQNSLVVLGSLLIGAVLGEWWQIEQGLSRFGSWLERRFAHNAEGSSAQERFIRGFLTASLIFLIGPMAILGSIEDGMTGNFQVLAIKSTLDGFLALVFASSLGPGVLFSALPILVYQGGITLMAGQVQAVVTPLMMNEMSATGGLILMAVAISGILEIRPMRPGNYIPALVIAPLLVFLLILLGFKY